MSTRKPLPPAIGYGMPFVLIQTFQYIILKDALNYTSPQVFMGLRFLIASLIIFTVARRFKPILNRYMILLSLGVWASNLLLGVGLEYVSAAESAVLSYTMPLISIPISMIILSEKASGTEWGGAFIGFVGVLVYSFSIAKHTVTAVGVTVTLVSAFFWALYTVYYRKLRSQDPIMTVATQLFFASLLFLLLAPLGYRFVAAPNLWFDLAYLSILGGAVSVFLWNAMARAQTIGKTSTLVYLVPVTTTLVQSVQTSIMPDLVSLIGLGLMTLGTYISTGMITLQKTSKLWKWLH